MKKRRGTDWVRHEQARRLLGENFIGPVEIEDVFPFLKYDPRVIKALLKTIPPREKLLEIKNLDLVLIAGPPKKLVIPKIMELFPTFFSTSSHSYKKISNQRFSREEYVGPEWMIISKKAVANSEKKDLNQQRSMLMPEKETVPMIVELTWGTMLQMAVNKDNLNYFSVRTSSVDSKLGCACLALINRKIHFFSYDNKGRNPDVRIFKKMKS